LGSELGVESAHHQFRGGEAYIKTADGERRRGVLEENGERSRAKLIASVELASSKGVMTLLITVGEDHPAYLGGAASGVNDSLRGALVNGAHGRSVAPLQLFR
jgi:hypothetical protein